MITRQRLWGFMVVLTLTFALALGAGFTTVAKAASEDVAMFYDELAQHGQWADYKDYGPVWRPTQVPEDWRPYTNGRWVPTNEGNVFETQEPWGWATYHYGNWMPTESNGWVWVPGRTWYPSTVEWRTSPETAPEAESYIGWAPIPPPNYVPPPAYAPPSYYPGSPIVDLLTAPFWIFAKAASFLLGFGQPYTPDYSYIGSGILVPPAYVPVFFSRTVILPVYVTPTYYPPAFIGPRRLVVGYYNMGPPVPYLARVTRINQAVLLRNINNYSTHITRIHNVVPPRRMIERYGYLRQIVPPALAQGRPLPQSRPATNVRLAQVNLNRPNMLPAPQGVPRLNAQIPRVQPGPRVQGQVPGTALPARATMRLTPQMTRQIEQLPPGQRFVPARAQPFKPAVATRPGPGQVQPRGRARPGQFQPGAQTRPGGPPAGRFQPGEFHPGAGRPGTTPGATAKPGRAPLPPGYRGLTPEQRGQREQVHQRLQRGAAPGQFQKPRQRQLQPQQRQREQQLGQQQRQQQPRQRQLQQKQRRIPPQQQRQLQQQQRRPQPQIQQQGQRQPEQRRQPPREKSKGPEERP